MQNYKIIAVDLDGTLLNTDMALSEENRAAIGDLADRGVYVVPSTGRTLSEIPTFVRDDPNVRYIIHSCGSVLYDKQTKTRVTECMDRALSARVLAMIRACKTSLCIHANGKAYVKASEHSEEGYAPYRVHPNHRRLYYATCETVEDLDAFADALDETEMYVVFFAEDAELEQCRAALLATGEVQIVSSAPHNIEIVSAKAGKGTALLQLAELLGESREATMAVGDSTNDSDMVKKAGLGVAMANACDALKAIADVIACHNNEHILPYLMEKYFT